MLFFTGFTRLSSDIQEKTKASYKKNKIFLDKMLDLVDSAQSILEDDEKDIDDFGRLLDVSWKLKRSISNEISSSQIDNLYNKGILAGALGGKLLGAGGGGFLLFYVPKEKQSSVRSSLKLLEVPFVFEDHGTQIIYYSPENDYDKSFSLEGNKK